MLTRRQRASLVGGDNDDNKDAVKKRKNQSTHIKEKTRKRKSVGELVINDDSNTTSIHAIQNGVIDAMIVPELINFHTAIKHVLKMKYANVVERLHLTFPAKCTQSLLACNEQHIRNADVPISDNITASQTFLKTKQPHMFIHSVLMDVVQNKFPGRSALQSLFELILCINVPLNGEYDIQNTIDMCAFTIGNIFEKFPPCWQGANAEYRNFIKATEKNLILGSTELLNNRTLFADIIHCIESVIEPPKKTTTPRQSSLLYDSFNDSLNDSIQLLNFHQWELKNTQKYSFDNQTRDEKIDRLFLTLALFVQLFEIDLAMWTIKNLPNPSAKISTKSKDPLVCTVLLANDESVEVNFCIKNILKLYINYINIDFPIQHTKVLGRLVNLIYNIFELREIRKSEPNLDFPLPVENQSRFGDSFTKIIFDNVGCNVESWLKIINVVEHPRMQLYLINALLTKIEHKNVSLDPATIYLSLKKIESNIDDGFDEDVGQNNNVVKAKFSTVDTSNGLVIKYPYLQKISRRASSELSLKQLAELHLTGLNAYMSVFHIKEIQNYWKNFAELEKKKIMAMSQYQKDLESFQQDPAQPFDLNSMDELQKQSFDERVSKITNQSNIFNLDVMNKKSGITEDIDIKVNTKKYRENVKYSDMIANEMPILQKKFSSLFSRLN